MKAVVSAGDGRVEVTTTADPAIADPRDAIVRVRRTAVCGTDLHVIHDDRLPRGFVLGHEYAGEVVETGPAVFTVAAGDTVAGSDYAACGACWWCRRGDHWECPHRRFFGTGEVFGPPLAGSQAELVRVPYADATLRPVPAGVGLDAAVLLGDTLATAYAAINRTTIRYGDTVAVVGGGPVGQLISLAAQALGAGPVVVVEPVAARRAVAAANGALTTPPKAARALVDELTDGRGADAVIEAVGGRRGLDAAFGLVRARGTVVGVGVQADDWALPTERSFGNELTLTFVVGDFARDGDAIGELVRSGALDPAGLGFGAGSAPVGGPVGLAGVPDAYARMADRHTLKVLVTP